MIDVPGAQILDLEGEASAWLYKEGGAVCGPVTAAAIIDKLYEGAIDGETHVSREFGEWRRLCEIREFEQPLQRAREALVAQQVKRRERRQARLILLGRVSTIMVFSLFFGGFGFVGGRELAIRQPWADHTDWSSISPKLVGLPAGERQAPKQKWLLAPGLTKGGEPGSAEAADPELALQHSASLRATRKGSGERTDRGGSSSRRGSSGTSKKSSKKGQPADEDKVAAVSEPEKAQKFDPTGLPQSLSQKEILKVLATQKNGIQGCIRTEATQNPDIPDTVTIEFVITREGTAVEFKVLERAVRDGPLADCLRGRINALRWPQFYGENKTVKIPFTIRRR